MSLILKKENHDGIRTIGVFKKDIRLCTISVDRRMHFENIDIEESYINDIILIANNFLLFYTNIYENNTSDSKAPI